MTRVLIAIPVGIDIVGTVSIASGSLSSCVRDQPLPSPPLVASSAVGPKPLSALQAVRMAEVADISVAHTGSKWI